MGNVKFYLKRPKAEKSAIICQYSIEGKRIKIYSGYTIPVKQWDSEEQKAKTRGYNNGIQINQLLNNISEQLENYLLECRAKNYIPTDNDLKACIEPEKAPNKNLSFWHAWESYTLQKGESKAMKLKLNAIKKRLKNYETNNNILTFESLNLAVMENIEKYFITIENLQNSTTAKHLSFFKSFLHWAVNREITDNIKWQRFTISNPPDKLKVVLSPSEIQKLKLFEAKEKQYLANVRDLFLVGCYTGLRFSDFTRIQSQHLKVNEEGEPFLKIRQEKTEGFVEIPLTEEAHQLCKKIISKEIRIISNQKMNEYLKELGELAGIDEVFETEEFRGKTKTSKIVPKWQLIGTHTARRTFATNLLIQSVPAEIVMQYTGHKDYKSFAKYVNIPKNSQHNSIRKAILNYAG